MHLTLHAFRLKRESRLRLRSFCLCKPSKGNFQEECRELGSQAEEKRLMPLSAGSLEGIGRKNSARQAHSVTLQ